MSSSNNVPTVKKDEEDNRETQNHEPVFRSIRMDEDQHTDIEYRSIAIMAPPAMNMTPPSSSSFHSRLVHHAPAAKPVLQKQASASFEQSKITDTTDYSTLRPRVIPPVPFRLEPHTCAHITGSASLIRVGATIGRALAAHDIVSCKLEKAKWIVSAYGRHNQSQHCRLHIKLYTTSSGFVVEFQRREGDVVLFMQVFHETMAVLQRHQLLQGDEVHSFVTKFEGVAAGQGAHKVPLLDPETLDDVATSQDIIIPLIAPVYKMLTCDKLDVQQTGMTAILSLCDTNRTVRRALVTTAPALVRASTRPETARLACLALAKVADEPTSHRVILETPDWPNLVSIAAYDDLGHSREDVDTRLAALAVLTKLSLANHWATLARVPGADVILDMLHEWQDIPNVRLREGVRVMRSVLREAGVV